MAMISSSSPMPLSPSLAPRPAFLDRMFAESDISVCPWCLPLVFALRVCPSIPLDPVAAVVVGPNLYVSAGGDDDGGPGDISRKGGFRHKYGEALVVWRAGVPIHLARESARIETRVVRPRIDVGTAGEKAFTGGAAAGSDGNGELAVQG